MGIRPCGIGVYRTEELDSRPGMGRGRAEEEQGDEGGGRSSPLLKLDAPECQEDDSQAEPHAQGHALADGLWAV